MKVEIQKILGQPVVIRPIGEDEAGYIFGTCLEKKIFTLWHMYVPEEKRRQGYATKMVKFLMRQFEYISTEIVTKESKALLRKLQFEHKDGVWFWCQSET